MLGIYKLLLILSVTQVSYCCKPGFMEKVISSDIDYSNRLRFPWLVVISNFKFSTGLSYGSIIHPKAVLTTAIDMEGQLAENLAISIDCEVNFDRAVGNCTERKVIKIIYPDDYNGQPTSEKFYALLILQTPFDITPTTQPISLTNSMELVDGESCRVFHWLRLYSFKSDSYAVIPEDFPLPYINGSFNINFMDPEQLKESRDYIIKEKFTGKTAVKEELLPLHFSGSPIVCILKSNIMDDAQVGIATFGLKVSPEEHIAPITGHEGSSFVITNYYNEIMKKLKENVF